jgi:hypothetical protein
MAHDVEQHKLRIAEAAYYRAESRGFEPGFEVEDGWQRRLRSKTELPPTSWSESLVIG